MKCSNEFEMNCSEIILRDLFEMATRERHQGRREREIKVEEAD
jgi:hypothetical protein